MNAVERPAKMVQLSQENWAFLFNVRTDHAFPSMDTAFEHIKKVYEKALKDRAKEVKP